MNSQLEPPLSANADSGRRPVVVCIDDDPAVLGSLRRLLREERYTVIATSDPEVALGRIQHPPVDVFIADQRLPGLSGTDLLRVVEQQSPATRRVIISAYPESAVRPGENRTLVQHFIPKPWNDDLLKAILRRLTGVASRTRILRRGGGTGFMREIPVLVECGGRPLHDIVPRMIRLFRKARTRNRGVVAVLEGLSTMQGDPGALLADLELGSTLSGVSLALVDGSGMAERYCRLRGGLASGVSVHGPEGSGRPRSFLLVDPENSRRVFVKLLLNGLGHVCRTAKNADEARAAASGQAFDWILADLGDPEELMEWIQELAASARPTPVIPLLPPERHLDPAVLERWGLSRPLTRPYAFRELLELAT